MQVRKLPYWFHIYGITTEIHKAMHAMKRKKVLYVITKSSWGGAQRYVFDLATGLPKDTFDVAVATGGNGLLLEKLKTAGVRSLFVPSFTRDVSVLRDLRTFRDLVVLFQAEAPDVVHLNSAKAMSIGALAARVAGVPRIIATIHGYASSEAWRPWWQRVLIRAIERFSRVLAHETVVVSAQDHVRGTTLIHNGIGDNNFKSREDARRELGLPHDACVIGTIGELVQNKNHGILIDAFCALPEHTTALAIIGTGEMDAELQAKAAAHPSHNICFLGYRDNAAHCLRAFDIFALTSLKEGLPYVLLEAGSAGVSVVATRVGGIPEIIKDGVSGLLVPSEDISALSKALQALIEDSAMRAQYGNALQEKIKQEFTLETMLAATTALY